MNVIDLFCGCGGFSLGFYNAGFKILLGTDIWSDAIQTYKFNFPNTATITQDITNLSPETILELSKIKKDNIDVIIGGPPCQGFSISGKRILDDPRNILYKSFVRIVNYIQPKAFVMENVPGIIKLFNGQIKNQVIENFSNIGYNVVVKQLCACDYGVPQMRKRVFFVGLNKKYFGKGVYFNFPDPTYGDTEKPYVTSKEAISDLDFIDDSIKLDEISKYKLPAINDYQKKMREYSSFLLNHVVTIHTEKTKKIIKMVPDGGNYKNLPQELWSTRKVHIAWTRMNSNKPCFTIDTGHNHHFHYRANRVPTVRESARIQSFPDNFKFTGIKTSQLKQVGNAVPPLLAEAIATKLKTYLEVNKNV